MPPATVASALGGLVVDGLRELAALATGARASGRKAQLVAIVASALQGDAARRLYASLGAVDQAAVAEAVHALDGRFDAVRFRARYGCDPGWGSRSWSARSSRTGLDLLFCGGRVLPADLLAGLRAFVPAPAEPEIRAGATSCGALIIETERCAQNDLLAVLRLVEAGKVAVSDKTRRPGAATVKAIAAVLHGGDFYADDDDVGAIKAFAWPMIVQAAGLATASGNRLALTRRGVRALTEPPARTLAHAWTKWQTTKLIDELSRIDAIKGQGGRGKRGLTAVAGRRAMIADALAECPVGEWVAVEELLRHMRATGIDYTVARDAWHLYLCSPEYGSLGYDGHGGLLESQYALALLFEYAATLGLIDVACVTPVGAREDFRTLWGAEDLDFLGRYDGLIEVRLNALGAFCLGVADAYEPTAIQERVVLHVLPDLEIAVLGDDLTHADRLALDRYAEPAGDRVWRLRRERVLAAIESGDTVHGVRDFLTARSAAPLPSTVTSLLDDIARRAAALTDRGPALLIECADPALAVLLSRDRRTRAHCLLAGDRMLAVPTASATAFRRGTRELGYVVKAAGVRAA